jgi:hypothetical protein
LSDFFWFHQAKADLSDTLWDIFPMPHEMTCILHMNSIYISTCLHTLHQFKFQFTFTTMVFPETLPV